MNYPILVLKMQPCFEWDIDVESLNVLNLHVVDLTFYFILFFVTKIGNVLVLSLIPNLTSIQKLPVSYR